MNRLSILISGADIAGPTLAYWVLRAGVARTLIDARPNFAKAVI